MLQIPENLLIIITEAIKKGFTGCIEIHWLNGKPLKVKETKEEKI